MSSFNTRLMEEGSLNLKGPGLFLWLVNPMVVLVLALVPVLVLVLVEVVNQVLGRRRRQRRRMLHMPQMLHMLLGLQER
jgi:Flp pilus assembly protein TadB